MTSGTPTPSFGQAAGDLDATVLAQATYEAQGAICITDADIELPGPRIVYVNPAFTRITGYAADEAIGRNPRLLQGPRTDRAVLDRLRSDLIAGRSFEGETYNYRKDGTPFLMSWRIAPVHDGDGIITHFVAAQEDVTALRDAEQFLRDDALELQTDTDWLGALVRLSVTLGRTASPDDVLAQVIEAATGELGADGAAIILSDPERVERVLTHASGIDAAVPGSRSAAHRKDLVGQALERMTPQFRTDSFEPIGGGLGVHQGMVAVLPIGTGDVGAYGVLVLTWGDRPPFRSSDRIHLGLLAQLTTMTHRNTRALEDQRFLASRLQQFLLPEIVDEFGLEVASRYHAADDAAEVGGDWFDLVCLDDGRLLLFVGDVVGHGSEAAALMGEMRFTARGIVRHFTDPAEILDELDGALLTSHAPGRAMATMCVVLIDADGALTYCSAGHPYPVIRRSDGSAAVLEGAQCRLVGASAERAHRSTAQSRLGPGDALVAFSDGVFEIRGQDYDESYEALVERLATSSTEPKALCDAALGLGEHRPPSFRDDIVVLAVRRPDDGGSSPCPDG